MIKLQPVSPTNTSRTPPECRRKWRVHSGGWARSYAIILNTRGWRGRQWYLILVTGGERRRHGLFKWSKTTIPRGKELESVERRWKGVGENEGREEKKSCTAAAEKFAFHPFQRWRGPFIRSANQFESAQPSPFSSAKAWNAVENPLQTSPLSVSNWPLFIAPRINNFPSACVPLPPPLCSPLFPPFCVKNEVTKERKERGRWIFRGKEGLFLFFFPFEKKFVPITFIQMKNEVNCKTCAR